MMQYHLFHLLSTSLIFFFLGGTFSPRTDRNIYLLQENRNFLLLIFSISSLFGLHGQYSKGIFLSPCSAY